MLRHPVQWLRDRPQVWDALLALALGTVSLVGLLTIDPDLMADSNRDPDVVGAVLAVAIWVAVAFRRRWPEAVTWIVATLILPYWVLDYVDSGVTMAVLLMIYTLAAHVDRPRSLVVGLAVGVVLVAVMIVGVTVDDEDLPAVAVVANTVIFATAWTIGDSVRNRGAYLAEVEARADRAERDQAAAAERAVQEERVRIARELHDVVAHSVSVMVVQAGAGRRVLDRNPAQAAEALAVVESTGRNALEELRRLLGVLRQDEGATASVEPQPTAADLAALVQQWRDAGMDVALDADPEPAALPAGVGLTVYRIVQEGLTNAMKHAGPAQVRVVVRYGDDACIEVTDDGRGSRPLDGVPSAGQGLIGMRERVELFGGTLAVGPRPGGGFRVRATVPLARTAVA